LALLTSNEGTGAAEVTELMYGTLSLQNICQLPNN